MNTVLCVLICILIGYLLGSINPSYIIGKFHGVDIRKTGSGNAGASNTLITFGKIKGVICAILDIAKPCLAIWIAKRLFPQFAFAFVLTGSACILGHMYPFYMNFRGGKGLACLGGVVLSYDWKVFLIFLAGAVIIALVSDYICFVPMTASVIFGVVYGIMTKDIIGAVILLAVATCIIFKHRENLKRIKNGTELHISYLWNKNYEVERVQKNIGNN